MNDYGVSSKKMSELIKKMARFNVREEDIDENFIRSQGKGGQNVNKNSTCVQLIHRPTGIIVKCQRERYQGLNRFFARRLLVTKIETLELGRKSEEKQKIEKIKRQKRKRSKRAKEKVLKKKKETATKKASRSYIKKMNSEEL